MLMRKFLGTVGRVLQIVGIMMMLGMFTTAWLDFTDLVLAPLVGMDPRVTWALASGTVIMGSITLGVFLESRAEGVTFSKMW